jgi:serine/threonine protein kinase
MGSVSLSSVMHTADSQVLDFVQKCLTWDPSERLTAAQALMHPFISAREIEISSKDSRVALPPIHTVVSASKC